MNYILLILSLPTENATIRQRVWRTLKTSGAAVLRDGVYLLPESASHRQFFAGIAAEVLSGGGMANVMQVEAIDDTDFQPLFGRSQEYQALLADIMHLEASLASQTVAESLRLTRKLRKAWVKLSELDFFPGEAKQQTDQALLALEQACIRLQSPDEPQASEGAISRLDKGHFQGRLWATRQRPWVDRLASAWLILRFIDPQARFVWLANTADMPDEALGFDFDGATFTHIGQRVTFEVLSESFTLAEPAITRLGHLVHFLDVGGAEPKEAIGVETILAGLRTSLADDNVLLAASCAVFDGLMARFRQEPVEQNTTGASAQEAQ